VGKSSISYVLFSLARSGSALACFRMEGLLVRIPSSAFTLRRALCAPVGCCEEQNAQCAITPRDLVRDWWPCGCQGVVEKEAWWERGGAGGDGRELESSSLGAAPWACACPTAFSFIWSRHRTRVFPGCITADSR
jgi:hypothetical protein